jgi:hypothetical protein
MKDLSSSWQKSTQDRIKRMTRCADDAEKAAEELKGVNESLICYTGQQNSKAASVLTVMCEGSDTAYMHSLLSAWIAYVAKAQAEKKMHLKCKYELEQAQLKLASCKDQRKARTIAMMSKKKRCSVMRVVKPKSFGHGRGMSRARSLKRTWTAW